MILVTWETERYDHNAEVFQCMNEANKFVEQNADFETMSNVTFRTVGEIIQ